MSLTTGTTMGLGNVISQTAIEKRTLKTIDWARVSRFAAFGYLFSGPFLRYWYYGLDKYFAGAKLKPVKMMITDQIIAAPLLNSVILLYLPLSSGKSMIEAKKRFHEDFPTVMKANYLAWPAIQLTNFYFIPIQHRVLFVNICSLVWSTFLAFVTK
ncbi:unnamed protein product [Adineta ricciae]|uniref:Mitochondrial inner membrane protein Mpv17 n=1 Tax=Adineta ricciae TaxID=249248 RepID=A0A813TBS5_ADIRI|nr:unnamed protein product [Adineta ricciae]